MDSIVGTAAIRHHRLFGFPRSVLVAHDIADGGTVVARLGRDSWFRTFYGKGRRIEFRDGTSWRLCGVALGGIVLPVIRNETGKLTIGGARGGRCYAVDGRDYAFNLYPYRGTGPNRHAWSLRDLDTEVALLRPRAVTAHQPVPVAALVMCFALIRYGVPGEHDLGVPSFSW